VSRVSNYRAHPSYSRVEHLGHAISCETCGTNQLSTKQMHFSLVPLILCFHLKRFEHSATTSRRKIGASISLSAIVSGTFVAFPLRLDVGRFMAAGRRHSTHGMHTYELYAVVCHEGGMDSGHYLCYVRRGTADW